MRNSEQMQSLIENTLNNEVVVDFEEHQALKKYYDAVEILPDLENVAHGGKEFYRVAKLSHCVH